MSRRDTIIVAVLINAGLLTLLFATAMNSDDDQSFVRQEVTRPAPERKLIAPATTPQQAGADEVDQAIAAYQTSSKATTPTVTTTTSRTNRTKRTPTPTTTVTTTTKPTVTAPAATAPEEVVVRVKEGDNLERIARANGTTVKAIMETNNLRNFTVQVGQELRIPLKAEEKPEQPALTLLSVLTD